MQIFGFAHSQSTPIHSWIRIKWNIKWLEKIRVCPSFKYFVWHGVWGTSSGFALRCWWRPSSFGITTGPPLLSSFSCVLLCLRLIIVSSSISLMETNRVDLYSSALHRNFSCQSISDPKMVYLCSGSPTIIAYYTILVF